MRQFVAYANRDAASAKLYPLLLNVQSDLIEAIATRVVVPLLPQRTPRSPAVSRLSPIVSVQGADYVMMTPLIAGVDAAQIGGATADLSPERSTILGALDLLISGI